MASLIPPGKLKTIYYVDMNGRKVKKGTPGAVKKVSTNRKYYISYRRGTKPMRMPAYGDKRSSEKKMAELETALDRGHAGLTDLFKEHRERKTSEHLDEYLPVLRERVTNDQYRICTERILKTMLVKCRANVLGDLTAEVVETYLVSLKVAPNTKKKHYSAMSGFVRWLFRHKRLAENFMLRVDPPTGGVVRKVRSLDRDEVQRLLDATSERPLREALLVRRGPRKGQYVAKVRDEIRRKLEREGRERHALYITSTLTALRKDELARLKVGYLDFEHQPYPLIILPANATKGKHAAPLWLEPLLADELKRWVQENGLHPDDKLFRVPDKLNRIFLRDLKAAGIPVKTDKGVASFRSLRKTGNVLLRQASVDPHIRKLFMRHTDIRLTTDTYDDGRLADMAHIVPILANIGLH